MANEVDSTVLFRGDNCTAPCYSWPASFDSLHRQAVGYRRDRAGRDTARVDPRGKATTYRLDRLGRVVSRRPWADSATVKDSLVYDLAGNVVKTITRRGYVITTHYDSRNRDTLAVIPTVGTMRKALRRARPTSAPGSGWRARWTRSAGSMALGYSGLWHTAWSGTVPASTYTYDPERPTTGPTRSDWRPATAARGSHTLLTPLGDCCAGAGRAADQSHDRARTPIHLESGAGT